MATTEPSVWDKLKAPFPSGTVGSLPKPTISNDEWKKLPKSKCATCKGYHATTNTIHLDYVGHAAVTDRLNSVDPTWTWEAVAIDTQGSPALDKEGNLWIRLTINGVTRLGVGDGKNMKERVGDAIRNAAMRFGVALDLWTKDELESTLDNPELKNDKPSDAFMHVTQSIAEKPVEPPTPAPAPEPTLSIDHITELMTLAKRKGYSTKEAAIAFLDAVAMGSFSKLPDGQYDSFRTMVMGTWKKPEATE